MPNILHQVSVPVMDNDSCQEMFDTSGHKKKIRESFLCAGYKEGEKDSCEVSLSSSYITLISNLIPDRVTVVVHSCGSRRMEGGC